jgi:transcriptional regulator with XRE-family HTH domain
MTEVGAQLRVAREAAGLSLAQLARRTCYGKSYLGNIETGIRRATPDVILAYERALGDEMERRGLLTGLAASVVAPAAVGALIQRGFQAALDGPAAADTWQERADRLGHDYMVTGAAELQARLAGDLVVIQQHLESPALWAAAARMLTVYGKTTPGAREAARWYRLAAVAADRSGDIPTRVWVRGRSALALAYEGAGLSTATAMAEQALGLSDKASLGSLNAHMALAHAAVHRGDNDGALEHLEDGRRVFDRAGSDEQVSDFAVPEWRMETFTSMLLSRMGHAKAVEAQDAADRARPSTLPRFATHIELHRALMMVNAGDTAGGLAYARAALDALPPERHSLSLRLMMAEIEKAAA